MPRPARPWFRFYSEQLESRKSQALGRQNAALFVQWINLLCLANITEPRGYLPPVHDVAFALRVTDADALATLEELRGLRFVSKDRTRYRMHDWDDWQKKSDANLTPARAERNTERTPKERAKNADRTHREEKEKEEEIEKEERERRPRAARHANPLDQLVADFAQIGRTNSATVGDIEDAVDAHGLEKVQMAVKKARASGKDDLPWSYVDSILEGGSFDEPKRNGRLHTPEPADSGVSAEHERLGLGQPARYVANPFVQRDATGRALKAVDAGGAGNG